MSRLTPAAAAVVAAMEAGFPRLETFPAAHARALAASAPRAPLATIEVGPVRDLSFAGPAGPVAVRLFTPEGVAPFAGGHPAIVYFHGGGFVIGDLDTYDRGCRALCRGTDATVVSVDYRLAPEHPFPAAPDDALAALRWVADNAAALGVDARRLAVAGDSAGGTLATVTAIAARDAGTPPLRAQLLIYPGTQMRADTDSRRAFAGEGYFLHRETMEWFEANYLARPQDAQDPRASPLLEPDLSGLAPAHIVLPECDPLHDEGVAYAQRLLDAGIDVTVAEYAGMFHGFFNLGHLLPEAATASSTAYAWTRALLHAP